MFDNVLAFLASLVKPTAAMLIILDPVGLLPMVIGMTANLSSVERRRLLSRATLVGLILLLAFTVAGTGIMRLFDVTLADLRVAGGILLLIVALNMALTGQPVSEAACHPPSGRMGIVPIASPLLVGPGAITAAVVIVGTSGLLVAMIAVTVAFGITWLVLRSTDAVYRLLGQSGSEVIARIMGMFLAAIAVQYVRAGVTDVVTMLR